MEEASVGYAQATNRVTREFPAESFAMSDGAEEYRKPARIAFSDKRTQCQSLMCWFHMKDAVLDFVKRHAPCAETELLVQEIGNDLDMMHHSAT
eukprot:1412136-Pyramimonas_sp.AAC.1